MINPETLDLSSLPSLPLSDRKQLPAISCIYFAMSSGTVQYIGRSKNLRNRWMFHHRQSQLDSNSSIVWLEVGNPALLPDIEADLIQWFKPPLNVIKKDPTKVIRIPITLAEFLKKYPDQLDALTHQVKEIRKSLGVA